VSKIIESLRGDLAALHEVGAISKVTMREFDAICPPPVREFSGADIKRLREALKFSQPVFALHLHTTASTVRKWEQGETPSGRAGPQAAQCHRRQGLAGHYLRPIGIY
jgi:putative transcriptional regulator